MGCGSSHEEPPRQQPTTKRPTATQAANLHPSVKEKQPQQQQQEPAQNQERQQSTPPADTKVESTPPVKEPEEPTPAVKEAVEPTPAVKEAVEPTPAVEEPAEPTPAVEQPVESTPAVEEPVESTPAVEEPVEPTPAVEEPVEPTPAVEEPAESTPPVEEPVESTPAVEEPVESSPPADALVESTPPVKETAVVLQEAATQEAKKEEEPVVATGPSWRTLLMELSNEDPWNGERRENRPHWKDILEEAKRLVATPRKALPEDIVLRALRGDVSPGGDQMDPSDKQSRVTIFISSTFTDTRAERNLLMRDVYPYLRTLCRFLDMDFGTVDMRWGIKEELAMEHGTTEICISEVNRCLRESAGPAFLTILGHKYGYRTLPVEILQSEFDKLISLLEAESEHTTIIKDFYGLDTNAIPPCYVLQPRDPDDSDWWNREKKIIALFRTVAEQLGEEDAEKYFISITEKEVKSGFLDNKMHQDQVICLTRDLKHVTEKHHLHRHIIDMKGDQIDTDAQKYLAELRDEKIASKCTGVDDIKLDFNYEEDNETAVRKYVVDTCDKTCETISRKILNAYEAHHHVIKDPIYDEVIQHQKFAAQKCEVFVGRENLVKAITDHIEQSTGKTSKVLGVFGTSGCGKTALMAVAAKEIKEKVLPQATVVLRFMGTTTHSGSARAVLYSICTQIARVYGKDANAVPTGYSELIAYFQGALTLGTESQPIVVFLDSLDQLSNEDFGQNLKWLSLKENLPPHAYVVVSSIPGGCLDALKAYLPESNLIHVTNMSSADGPLLLDQMLAAQKRTVTENQRKVVLNAFAKCPLPLFLRLAVDIAANWHSYDEIPADAIADDMPGLINALFERVESRFGAMFVEHALAYITCAKDGLSVGELEDILSCDDDVLDYLFDFWLPPFRRVPQLLWIRVRNELGSYLMERGTNGVNAYGWYHRQFWETAAARYLDNGEGKFRLKAHEALADYFEGKWAEGKLWTPIKLTRAITDLTPRMEKRQVPRQPLTLSGSRSTFRQLNRRKLAELPTHLLALGDWDRLEQQVATLEFIEAKFEADQGYETQSFFLRAADQSGRKTIRAISKFIGLGLPHLLAEPLGVYQLANQQAQDNPVHHLFDNAKDGLKDDFPRKFSRNQKGDDVDDPCEMTMRGHTSGVRCVRFNPKGHLIASTSEDGSVRMWDTFSGAEVVTVTDLPGPKYPRLADPYHGERPCVWDKTGHILVTGSEDGGIQVWDTNGAQVKAMADPHSQAVTGVDISPDNSTLVSVSKDGNLKAWSMTDFSLISTVQVGNSLGCVYSPDGAWVAVSLYGGVGLRKVRVSDWSVQTAGNGYCNMNLCVDYSPTGSFIVTGGDDSSITVWDGGSGQATTSLKGHRGWIWCVHFNASGSRLLSCSSDRSLRLWNMTSMACLVTLGGHMHRVTWACFRPGKEDTFVTGSLDMSLKVWDYEAVASGRTPPAGNLHYSILECSPNAKYIATCQGWSMQCNVLDPETDQIVGQSPQHQGCLLMARFTPDSEKLITVDEGHQGAYEDGAIKKAVVKVSSDANFETVLPAYGPTSIATTKEAILVGTIEDKLLVFDSETLEHVHTWDLEESKVTSIATSLTDDVIATAYKGDLNVMSVGRADSSLTSIFKFSRDDLVIGMTFSPNGKYLAVGYFDGLIQIRNAADRSFSEMYTLKDHTGKINGIAFSNSEADDFFVSSSLDMTMRIWDVKKGFQLHSVYYAPINYLGFVKNNVLVIGESTGNKKYVEFDV